MLVAASDRVLIVPLQKHERLMDHDVSGHREPCWSEACPRKRLPGHWNIGEMRVAYAIKKGVTVIVINGVIRDAASIGAGDFRCLPPTLLTVTRTKTARVKSTFRSPLVAWSSFG
jgi:hypothetical protein